MQVILFEDLMQAKEKKADSTGALVKSVSDDQYQIIKDIVKLYAPDGFDIDPTYSKGVFYKSGEIAQPRLKFDLFPQTEDTIKANANNLPFENDTFDYYIISFGIRNVTDIDKSLNEAYRVLKNGGRFFCLEFSKVENELLKNIYKKYSRLIPKIGKFIAGSDMPYEYLVESIEKFYNQEEFSKKLVDNSFANVEHRNLTNGIAAIHTGWKIE